MRDGFNSGSSRLPVTIGAFLFLRINMTNITQDQRKAEEIANYRVRRGGSIAERLKTISDGSKTAQAVAFRLEQCTMPENTWTAEDLHTKDGELFAGTGNLFSCGSKLCPACSANQSREMRKRARSVVQSLGNGDYFTRWRSIVLTMPLQRGASVLAAIEKINKAFELLRKRMFWKSRVKGGIKSVEFTVRPEGYHVHIHLLILSEHLPVNAENERRFSRFAARRRLFTGNLTDEMAYALKAAGVALNGSPIVAVYDVRNRNIKARGNREISLEKALLETAKYLTKSESWDKIPDSSLVEIAEISRWKRMFEVLGKSRGAKSESSRENPYVSQLTYTNQQAYVSHPTQESLVHTKTLFDGERSKSWRELLKLYDFEIWKRHIQARIRHIQAYRKMNLASNFGFAEFRLMNGETFGFGM